MGLDIILLINFMTHLMYPAENLMDIGFPFLWLYPGLPIIAPFTGIIAIFKGSPSLMKLQANMNSTCVMFNYFLTFLMQMSCDDEPYYKMIIILLILNKITLSAVGAKVRQNLINPGFVKYQAKLQKFFREDTEEESVSK